MKSFFRYANNLPDGAKFPFGVVVMLSICYAALAIGLIANKVSIGYFISHDNAGTGGQIVWWAFVAIYAWAWIKYVTAKK